MHQTIEAIYEDGVFKPLQKVNLPEHSRLRVEIIPLHEAIISLRDLWKGAGSLSEKDLEAAKHQWEAGVEEQLTTLKGSSR